MASRLDPRTHRHRAHPAVLAASATAGRHGMAERIRRHDWTTTSLGGIGGWPPHLRASVDLMAAHGFPMMVLWGPELLQIYNDGYADVMLDRHPAGLGQATAECWPEAWPVNRPLYEQVGQGRTLTFADECHRLRRKGCLQDAWFTITYSPLRDADGGVDGVLVTLFDTTAEHGARVECEQAARELRARNESLRANEERFQQFAAASSDALWIRDAGTLETELLSSAFDGVYGLAAGEAAGALRHWAARVVPDDREAAISRLGDVRDGQARVHEFRVQREDDGQFRWIRDSVFPLFDAGGQVSRIAGISRDVTDERHWAEHQSVLVAELQHRVRNIMATIGSITLRTRESATSVDDYAQRLSGRVMSLARTQALLTRAGNVGIDLQGLIIDELSSQSYGEGRIRLHGPGIMVPPKAAEVLSLAIHELATNALRHGALRERDGDGGIDVRWQLRDEGRQRWVDLRWCESHAARPGWQPPQRRGFGTALVEDRIPYELEGMGRLRVSADGTEVNISFPLRQRDSILQTDVPQGAGIAGGSVDLGDTRLLAGCRVLVVEDDFYLAHDTATALRSAGALVKGPCASLQGALELLSAGEVDAAAVDVNLGQGAETTLISALQSAGLPFVVVSGREDPAVAATSRAFVRLQKPASAADIARALARQVNPTGT